MIRYLFLGVVIPTYERPDDLKKCLESLSKENQTTKIPYEIIVSDDSKTNKSRLLIDNHFACELGKRKTEWTSRK